MRRTSAYVGLILWYLRSPVIWLRSRHAPAHVEHVRGRIVWINIVTAVVSLVLGAILDFTGQFSLIAGSWRLSTNRAENPSCSVGSDVSGALMGSFRSDCVRGRGVPKLVTTPSASAKPSPTAPGNRDALICENQTQPDRLRRNLGAWHAYCHGITFDDRGVCSSRHDSCIGFTLPRPGCGTEEIVGLS